MRNLKYFQCRNKKKKKRKKRKEKQTFIVQNVREWSTKPFTNGNFSKHLLN